MPTSEWRRLPSRRRCSSSSTPCPTLGDCLLVNGDLFDFWFSYSRVIPRRGFHVAAALARLRRRLPIVMVGGNHDRWDSDFWERDLGLDFQPAPRYFRDRAAAR